MIIAASALTQSNTTDRHGRRKHQAKNRRVGQIAKPVPKLKEATNPAHTIIGIVAQNRPVFGIKRKASAAPAIVKEFSQLKPPDAVILARAIQKLPTITTRVDKVFAVRLTVLSRQTGIRSSKAVIKSSTRPAKKSTCWLP